MTVGVTALSTRPGRKNARTATFSVSRGPPLAASGPSARTSGTVVSASVAAGHEQRREQSAGIDPVGEQATEREPAAIPASIVPITAV